jgi:hypothetical protein
MAWRELRKSPVERATAAALPCPIRSMRSAPAAPRKGGAGSGGSLPRVGARALMYGSTSIPARGAYGVSETDRRLVLEVDALNRELIATSRSGVRSIAANVGSTISLCGSSALLEAVEPYSSQATRDGAQDGEAVRGVGRGASFALRATTNHCPARAVFCVQV